MDVLTSTLLYFLNFVVAHQSIMQLWKERKTGITIMYMVEKLDAGDILTQVEVEIEERETTGSLFDKLSEAGHIFYLKQYLY